MAKFLLTFGYAGLFPFMPGTIGSLVALVPVIFINYFFDYTTAQTILLLGIIFFFFMGVKLSCDYAIPLFGKEDPSPIVIDEVVGMWMAAWLWEFPNHFNSFNFNNWVELLVAFFLFRFFDITKIGGIRHLEKIGNGWGVMLDDLASGLISFLILQIWREMF